MTCTPPSWACTGRRRGKGGGAEQGGWNEGGVQVTSDKDVCTGALILQCVHQKREPVLRSPDTVFTLFTRKFSSKGYLGDGDLGRDIAHGVGGLHHGGAHVDSWLGRGILLQLH